jgi:hypothetical protein
MALNYVTLTVDIYDGQGNYPVTGTATFTPSAPLTDTTNHEYIAQIPVVAAFRAAAVPIVKLLATDNSTLAPSGWGWQVTFSGFTGYPAGWSFFLPFSGGASQNLADLAPVSSTVTMAAYAQVPAGDLGGTSSAPTVTGTHMAAFTPTGLTGATAATRYAGATTSGAPASGTFAVGDYVVDETGSFWVCTTAGTPGTWKQVGGAAEFASPMTTLGDLIYENATPAAARLAADTSNTRKFLRTQASGGVGQAPAWDTIAAGDVPALNQNTTGTAAGLSATLAIGSGGTGQTGAAAAYNALSTMTTTGDIEYESAAATASRLAGPTSSTKQFLTSTGTGSAAQAPAWGTVAAGDLPAATTSVQGAVILDGTAGDIQALGTQAAGNSTKTAAANHVHPAPAASAGFTPSNPTATSSTTLVMMGLGSTIAYTPTGTGRVLITISGTFQIATGVQFGTLGGRYGTSTAPNNGTAVSGTRFGASTDQTLRPAATGANGGLGWCLTAVIALTPSTAYWFDIALSTNNASDAASIQAVGCSIVELVS